MNRIDSLIVELCPDGVEFKAIGEIAEFIRGTGIKKSDFSDSGIGCIHYGQIHTHFDTWASQTKSFIPPEMAIRLRTAKKGDLVVATTSEDDDGVGKAVAWLGEENVVVSTDALIFQHSLNSKYLSYCFQTENFQKQKKLHITGTKVRRITGEKLAKIRIPVPPLEVQREIVKILDTFTELEAELEARRRQYKYYRDALLNFEESPPRLTWVNLGEMLNYEQPSKYIVKSANYADRHKTPVLTAGQTFVLGYTDETDGIYPASLDSPIIIFDDFTTAFKWVDFPFKVKSSAIKILTLNPNAPASLRYIYYAMQTITYKPQNHARQWIGTYSKFNLPIPPPQLQSEIVTILDEFDTLVSDLSSGLPAELQARRKQYKYYRDQLLTFKVAA